MPCCVRIRCDRWQQNRLERQSRNDLITKLFGKEKERFVGLYISFRCQRALETEEVYQIGKMEFARTI